MYFFKYETHEKNKKMNRRDSTWKCLSYFIGETKETENEENQTTTAPNMNMNYKPITFV